MKKLILIPLLFLLTVLALTGCAPASDVPATLAPVQASPTPVVPWQVVGTASFDHSVYYGGFMDKSFGITVGYGGEIHYTTDGGASWPQAENASLCRFGLDIVDSQVAWSCGNGGHVRVTTNGGKTWQPVTNFGPSEPDQCRYLSFLDEKTGWAATPTELGLTTDGGQTWTDVTLPKGTQVIKAVTLRTPSDGYLLDSAGKLYITADGGQTWIAQAPDFTQDAFLNKMPSPIAAMRFTDAQHGMIVLSRGNADTGFFPWSAYTADGGQTWQLDQLPLDKGIPFLYLSHDAATLTVLNTISKTMTILRFQKQ